eukprot:scaffold279971_cov36-Tisochrysis_lutea.AAC.2
MQEHYTSMGPRPTNNEGQKDIEHGCTQEMIKIVECWPVPSKSRHNFILHQHVRSSKAKVAI